MHTHTHSLSKTSVWTSTGWWAALIYAKLAGAPLERGGEAGAAAARHPGLRGLGGRLSPPRCADTPTPCPGGVIQHIRSHFSVNGTPPPWFWVCVRNLRGLVQRRVNGVSGKTILPPLSLLSLALRLFALWTGRVEQVVECYTEAVEAAQAFGPFGAARLSW